jgi:hypothetical protein
LWETRRRNEENSSDSNAFCFWREAGKGNLLVCKKARRQIERMGKRKVESSDEEDDDEPLILKSVAKKIHVESEDEDGGGKSGVGGDAEQGDAAQEKQADWSGSDEEDRFMRIMQQHGSPVKSSSKTLAKTAKAGATVSRSLSKSEDTKEDFDAGGAAPKATPSKADPTPGKIKFSKYAALQTTHLRVFVFLGCLPPCNHTKGPYHAPHTPLGTLLSSSLRHSLTHSLTHSHPSFSVSLLFLSDLCSSLSLTSRRSAGVHSFVGVPMLPGA